MDVDDFIAHIGVKGMKWGVRKTDLPGVSRKVNKEASKDAAEFARAKMFFGDGAGTRRKLIKASVESKSKKDPDYKKAFDHHLDQQDLGKHASKARSERKRKDVTGSTAKTARGVHRQLNGGGFGNVSLASALIATAYVGARRTGVDKIIYEAAKQKITQTNTSVKNKKGEKDTKKWLKDNGFM